MKRIEVTRGTGFAFLLHLSSWCEDYPCSLALALFGWYVSIRLPPILKPRKHKHFFDRVWGDDATHEKPARDWYWQIDRRTYGVSIMGNFLHVNYGAQTMDSSTEQSWGYFLPWLEWNFRRHSFYGLDGGTVADVWWPRKRGKPGYAHDCWEKVRQAETDVPKRTFLFNDFDGQLIGATTHIEEREWWRGTGWFKWLRFFCRPKICRSLDIAFSHEVGARKGSWKGGTVGHGIDMLPGELHEAAFRRYCEKENLIFVGDVCPDATGAST